MMPPSSPLEARLRDLLYPLLGAEQAAEVVSLVLDDLALCAKVSGRPSHALDDLDTGARYTHNLHS